MRKMRRDNDQSRLLPQELFIQPVIIPRLYLKKTGWLGVGQMNCSGWSQSPPEEKVIDFPEKKS